MQLLLFFYWKFTHFRHAVRVNKWDEAGSIIAHKCVNARAVCVFVCVVSCTVFAFMAPLTDSRCRAISV